jgi:predicted membrane-bound dolichyl-phosphate-mannose-protein mannosyltransferase
MWMRFDFEKTDVHSSVLHVKYTGNSYLDIYELVLLDEEGNVVPYSVIDELSFIHDEAELVDGTHSVLTSLYFDELLYSDTVDHYFVDGKILEGTHPPMGKNFIALGVLLFGHNTFGYRFFGALFSVLTLIVMFFLSRRILKKNMCALLATLLLFGDAMYYMQSRVCAIDIYVLCFILLFNGTFHLESVFFRPFCRRQPQSCEGQQAVEHQQFITKTIAPDILCGRVERITDHR